MAWIRSPPCSISGSTGRQRPSAMQFGVVAGNPAQAQVSPRRWRWREQPLEHGAPELGRQAVHVDDIVSLTAQAPPLPPSSKLPEACSRVGADATFVVR